MTLKVMKKRQIRWSVVLLIIGFLWMCPLIFMISMSLRKPEKAFEQYSFYFLLFCKILNWFFGKTIYCRILFQVLL